MLNACRRMRNPYHTPPQSHGYVSGIDAFLCGGYSGCMKRLCVSLLLCLVCVGSGLAESRQLNLFIWSEYIEDAIVRAFERAFDCTVTIELYEDNPSMLTQLLAGGDARYDVVVPSDYMIPSLISRGLIAPLRHEEIPNKANVDPRFLDPPYDRGNRFSLPYQWGTLGILVRDPKDAPAEDSWGLIFDPKKQPGPFLLIDDMREALSAALSYLGHSINSVDIDELKDAREILVNARRRSLGFAGAVEGKDRLLAGECAAVLAYSGDALRAAQQDPTTRYFVPREGSQIWVDAMVIPARAPNPEMAEAFINFILDARVGARLSNYTRFATPNVAALPHIREEDLQNPAIYPPPEVRARLEYLRDLGRDTRLVEEIWSQIKRAN